ncbi:hypothetical protein ACV3P9_13010 [Clostridium perfringens]|nr:hypothetical protein [Clostridium perfringens]
MSREYGIYSYDNLNSGEITMDRRSIKGIIFVLGLFIIDWVMKKNLK